MRFGGANQAELWNAFAKRGIGESASTDTNRGRPADAGLRLAAGPRTRPSRSRHRHGAVPTDLRRPLRGARHAARRHRSGDGARRDAAKLVPGTYERARPRSGLRPAALHARRSTAGQTLTQTYALTPNVASKSQGASASGDGHEPRRPDRRHRVDHVGLDRLDRRRREQAVGDDLVRGRQAGRLDRRQRAARPDDPDADEGRFTALRRFTVSSCDGRTANCSLPTSWKPLYTSPSDAFPSRRAAAARAGPDAADLRRRRTRRRRRSASRPSTTSARAPRTTRASRNADPLNPTDCDTGSDQGTFLHAAELEVFSQNVTG